MWRAISGIDARASQLGCGRDVMYDWRKKRALQLALMTPEELVEERSVASETGSPDVSDADAVEDHAQEIEDVATGYFEAQSETFPADLIEQLLESFPEGDSGYDQEENGSDEATERLQEEIDAALADWTDREHTRFEDAFTAVLSATAVAGFMTAFEKWMKRFGLSFGPAPGMMAGLHDWAKQQTRRLLALIDRTTRKQVAAIIAEGRKNGLSAGEIVGNVRSHLDSMVADRAERIGRVESGNAVNRGVFEANRLLGATEKRWVSMRDGAVCRDCWKNDRQGPIRIDLPFRSGDHRPPAHPRCRCITLYDGVTRESALQALGLMP
jgi:hypothetical protein